MDECASIAEKKLAGLSAAKAAVDGNTGLSRALGGEITPQAVSQWKQVPAERVLTVEKVTGVARHLLRPDLYPESEVAA